MTLIDDNADTTQTAAPTEDRPAPALRDTAKGVDGSSEGTSQPGVAVMRVNLTNFFDSFTFKKRFEFFD